MAFPAGSDGFFDQGTVPQLFELIDKQTKKSNNSFVLEVDTNYEMFKEWYDMKPVTDYRRREKWFMEYTAREQTPAGWPQHQNQDLIPFVDPRNESLIRFWDAKHNRYLSLRPGKYIARFFPNLDPVHYSGLWTKAYDKTEVLFARTSEDIVKVYTTGPESCMSDEASEYLSSPIHPCSVFGDDGDITLAYIRRGNRITARTLVWEEKKEWCYIYGDKKRMKPLLEALGFKPQGRFLGARIKRIYHDEQQAFVMPYLDFTARLKHDGDFFVVGEGSYADCERTCGLMGDED